MPAIVLTVAAGLGPKIRAALVLLLLLALSLLIFIQIKCFWNVGTFLPLKVLLAGLTKKNLMYAGDYIALSSILKLMAIYACVLLLVAWAYLFETKIKKNHVRSKRTPLLIAILIGCTAWATAPNSTPYNTSILFYAAQHALGIENPNSDFEYHQASPENLPGIFRTLTNTAEISKDDRYWQRAKDYDVIYFILEATPEQCTSFTAPIKALPNMNSLISSAFISKRHHSTYPYTVRAIFSIFSSWYPSNNATDFIKTHDSKGQQLIAPGVVRSLRNIGYKTAVFEPDDTDDWEHDKQRYNALGFHKQIFPSASNEYLATLGADAHWRAKIEERDLHILDLMKNEIAAAASRNKRYLFSFQPQYTHGPWPNVDSSVALEDTISECSKLMSRVDGWLGEVLQLLTSLGRLEKTLIVITGDHGIRTSTEHPPFNGGSLDAITFNVPLLVYAPNILNGPVEIDSLSSHIDITPTILDLIGVRSGRAYEQGLPIWDENLRTRDTYFLARNYLGGDAHHSENKFFSIKYLFGLAWATPSDDAMTFTGPPLDKDATMAIRAKHERMNAFMNKWSELLLPSTLEGDGHETHPFDKTDNEP